ncbi:hypothetical protein [uncultured Aquimarina sp.]|uniref:hypothetical protein n=1 Tax=uncultured Aquimarina sp. TaxID=575652 RepID=UPI0026320806|nr:hypothetical protein [uncultured Aquimarina sp.]
MISKEFLEEYSLFRKFKIDTLSNDLRNWKYKTPINMKCQECDGTNQTFNMINEYWYDGHNDTNGRAENRVFDLRYLCESCKVFERRFFIYINKDVSMMHKVGQYPEWEIKMDKNLEKRLHKHSKTFRKGLVCESQGYGIGAFSYYRRITEEIIDELLESISELIEEEHKIEYQEALEKTKNTRVTQEKIDLVKDLLPTILKPKGMNPLGVLHSELSEGLHAESDEACLENANHIKSILTFLINQIIQSKESARSFTNSMKSLLDKKAAK